MPSSTHTTPGPIDVLHGMLLNTKVCQDNFGTHAHPKIATVGRTLFMHEYMGLLD